MSALSATILNLLQNQYAHEKSNQIRYEARASRANFIGLTGTAAFFRREAEGEAGHAAKVAQYIADRNECLRPVVDCSEDCSYDLFGMIDTAMLIELETTEKLKAIAQAAMSEGDLQTFYWLSGLITEQTEEENLYQTILDRFALCGRDTSQIQLYDTWIGGLNG